MRSPEASLAPHPIRLIRSAHKSYGPLPLGEGEAAGERASGPRRRDFPSNFNTLPVSPSRVPDSPNAKFRNNSNILRRNHRPVSHFSGLAPKRREKRPAIPYLCVRPETARIRIDIRALQRFFPILSVSY